MRALVFGAGGLLGRDLVPVLDERGWEVRALGRADADVTDREAVQGVVEAWEEEAEARWVVNLAAYTNVDGAEADPAAAFAVNRDGAANVARAARLHGLRHLFPSTDYVFDGRRAEPYPTDARPSPLNVYGRSKLEGEEAVLGEGGRPLVVRTSWLYGGGGRNFVDSMLERGRRGEPLKVVDDQRGRPTWTRSLAETLAGLMEAEAEGLLHAGDEGDATWCELAREAFRLAGIPVEPEPVESAQFRTPARRPRYSVLDLSETSRILGRPAPHWKESLAEYLSGEGGGSPGEPPNEQPNEQPMNTP